MRMGARDGIGTLRPLSLHPFEIGEARAVDVLVHHARGQKRRVFGEGRRFKREFALLGSVRHWYPSTNSLANATTGSVMPGADATTWQSRQGCHRLQFTARSAFLNHGSVHGPIVQSSSCANLFRRMLRPRQQHSFFSRCLQATIALSHPSSGIPHALRRHETIHHRSGCHVRVEWVREQPSRTEVSVLRRAAPLAVPP